MKLNENFITTRGHNKYLLELRELSRKLRKNPTPAEKIIWFGLLKNKLLGFKFLRQKPIDRFILDFYCPKLLLNIEIDGNIHIKTEGHDEFRNFRLNCLGIKTIRYTNDDVLYKFNQVAKKLKLEIENRANEL